MTNGNTTANGSRVVVIGLGYVGLPLLLASARAGYETVGLDADHGVVDALRSGRSHVDDVSDDDLSQHPIVVTTEPDCIASADVVVICVPTPLTEDQRPDLSAVHSVVALLSDRIKPGALVVLESTTYPGTTDGPVRTRLEAGGALAGLDFYLAFSPERIDPGNAEYRLENTPKVVGGVTAECASRATEFYGRIVEEVVVVSGTREAEMAKLLENTYRHVNIALMNEMAVFTHELGIDLWEAIRAAATKPFGFEPFYPGPGVGGHCIPIDPNYLSHSVRSLGYHFRFVELAQEISQRMPGYVVSRVQDLLNDRGRALPRRARVVVLGLTYKAGIADVRETPARAVIRGFHQRAADIVVHDPLVSSIVVDDVELVVARDIETALESCDVAVVLQAHTEYLELESFPSAPQVFDTTGRLAGANVVRL